MDNAVLDIIIEFVKATNKGKSKTDRLVESYDETGNRYSIFNSKYLLGQIIRNYNIPKENYHVSKAAMELWNRLTSEDISNFFFDETIRCDRADNTPVRIYKGNSKDCKEQLIKKNDTVRFNDVFHGEHVIPVRIIIDKLLKLEDPTYDEVSEILKHIHICRILKDEDKRIVEKSNRPYDYREIVDTIYKKAGIEIYEGSNE